MSVENKNALITGASRGIGKAISLAMAKEGYNIAVNYLSFQADEADELVKELEELGVKAIKVQADVSDLEEVTAMTKEVIAELGSIDVLVNNAGITKDGLMLRMSEEQFDQVIDVNLKGTWNTMKACARPMLKQRGGSIINISSVVGLMGNPGQVNYVASKAGVIGMTKTLAKEFGPKGVTVNAVAPGFIKSDMTDKLSDEIKEHYKMQIPLNEFGTPEDIANVVLFLASDKARYITGQTISVNGGMI